MDDFLIIHNDKYYLKYCLNEITNKLKINYKLDINTKKTKIDNIKNGIEFLGYYFILKNNHLIIKLKNQTKIKIKKKISRYKKNNSSDIDYRNKIIKSLISYKGILKWGDCNNLYDKTIKGLLC